jgi:hypothetical protein
MMFRPVIMPGLIIALIGARTAKAEHILLHCDFTYCSNCIVGNIPPEPHTLDIAEQSVLLDGQPYASEAAGKRDHIEISPAQIAIETAMDNGPSGRMTIDRKTGKITQSIGQQFKAGECHNATR